MYFAKVMARIGLVLFCLWDITEKRAKVELQETGEKFNFRK